MKKIINFIAIFLFSKKNVQEKPCTPSVDLREQMIKKAKDTLDFLKQFKKSDFDGHSIEENHNAAHAEFKFNYNYLRSIIRHYSITNTELQLETHELNDFDTIATM